MKNLLRILILLAFFFGGLNHLILFAQRNTSGIIYREDSRSPLTYEKISSEQLSPIQSLVADFRSPLSQILFYGDSPAVRYVLTGSHSGYIIGTNDYNDLGKYQRFDFTGNSNLEQVKIYFCAKKIIGTADNFTLVVRSVAGNGSPSNLLYSATYSTTVIDTSDWPTVYNTFTISPTVAVSSSFFVGIEWTTSFDDQLAIIADQKGKGNAQKRAWEKWDDGTFHDIYTAWQDNSTGVYFDSDLWIAAVINDATIPTSPVLLLPANGATGIATSPTLSWNASSGATSYRLQVSTNSSFSTTVFDQNSISGTSQQVNGLSGNTIYYWRVNATNNAGTSGWSSPTWSFTTGQVQDQVVIKYDNGIFYNSLGSATAAMTVEASARFTQSIVSAYVGYQITSLQIYIKDLPLAAKLKIYDSGTATNPGTLLYSQTFTPTSNSWNTVTLTTPVSIANKDIWVGYEVSFAAGTYPMGFDAGPTNANGDFLFFGSTWSHLSALSTPIYANWNIHAILQQGQQPSPPVLLQPINGATSVSTNPTTSLSWNASSGAASYRLQISTNSNFSTIISDQSNITGTSQSVSGLSINTTYYWRVNASNSSGTSDWSSAWSFTTQGITVPQAPSLLLPLNGATNVPTSTLFSWNTSVGATLYNLQISKNSNFSSIDYNYSDLTGTSKQVDNLSLNTTYYWRVNASNSAGTSVWSSTWIFAVPQIPLAPILLSPGNGAKLGNNNPATFSWNASNSATSYRLQISENSSFSPNMDFTGITGTLYLVTGLSYNSTYYWRVNASNSAGTSPWSSNNLVVDVKNTYEFPKEYSISQNYPNPFNPSTTIKFSLPKSAYVSLKIYNNLGQEVAQLVSQEMSAGTFITEWDGSKFTSGVYYYKIIAGNFTETKKLLLMK